MLIKDFPYCCTAKIIVDFGESVVAEGGGRPVTYDEVYSYIKSQIELYTNDDYLFNGGYAMLIAITNSDQKTSSKALLELGFKHSAWAKKMAHPDTRIRLWWYPLMRNK